MRSLTNTWDGFLLGKRYLIHDRDSIWLSAQTNPLWQVRKVNNYLPHMTRPEVEDLLTRTDMVIIPVGAIEQHGLHLPMGTDFLNGVERAKLIAQRTDVLVAPVLMPGLSPYHMGFAGTITLPAELIQEVYFEAARSLMKHGFKRFLMLNSHGDPIVLRVFLAEGLKAEYAGKGTSAREMSTTGVWGVRDLDESSVEQGRESTEALVDAAVQFIARWKELRPMNR